MPTLPFDDSAKFTYNLGQWPQMEYIRLTFDSLLSSDTFTIASTTEVQRVVDAFDATTRRTVEDFPTIASDATVLTLLHEGTDIDFSRFNQYIPPVDCIIDKIVWNFAIGLDVLTSSAGTWELTSVRLELSSFKAPGQLAWFKSLLYATPGFTAMTVAGDNQYAVINTTFPGPIPLYQGGMFEIRIFLDTITGTGTSRRGIVPIFPYQAQGGLRSYAESGFKMYIRPMAREGGTVISAPATYATFARDNPQGSFTGSTAPPSPDANGGLNSG